MTNWTWVNTERDQRHPKVLSRFKRENDQSIDRNRKGSRGTCFVWKSLMFYVNYF